VERLPDSVHDRPRSEARVPLAVAAAINHGAVDEGEGWTDIVFVMLAVVANEAFRKTFAVEVAAACFLACELFLEVKQRLWNKTVSVTFGH